jgi:hypothetical protein
MVKRLYDVIANRLNCCIIGFGCGLSIILTGGALTGAADYGAYQVLS